MGQQTLGSETAIVHVLDSKFLQPLKVLRYSLAEHEALTDCSVVVISDDPAVVEDPFVRGTADQVEYVSPAAAAALSTIRGDRIAPKLATPFAPKYTFLKLLMFKNRGFERHVFIDADMLCLKPLDEELIAAPFNAKAVREFGPTVFPTRKEQKSADFPNAALRYVEEYSAALATEIAGINSGFLVLEGEGIQDELFDAAIEMGRAEAFPSEQALTTEMIRRDELTFLRLPLWYNARRRMFASLGSDFFHSVFERIVLLHYTPGKPWRMSEAERQPWDELWLNFEERSRDWVRDISSRAKSATTIEL